ncbi:MAG: hypothetical protein R3E31_06825 [Chloroflexota bacterium]
MSIEKLWQYILEDGYIASCDRHNENNAGWLCGMNVHGKNVRQVGPIGNHILQFDLMLCLWRD